MTTPLSTTTTDASGTVEDRLVATGITVRFGGLVALDTVDISVPPASITGLVGPNGAGKSTLFAVLSGLLRPKAGRVRLNGVDITGASPQARATRGLARTFQHPELFSGLTVRDHLTLGHRMRHSRGRLWSDLVTGGGFRKRDKEEVRRVDGLIEILGLGPVADRPAVGLPLGTSRLVEVGRALATAPDVLLLDEPSSGLDVDETAQLAEVLRMVVAQRGVSMLLVEHDVDLVLGMCGQVVVLDFGQLVAAGGPEEIRANPAVRAAYLGEETETQSAEKPDNSPARASGEQDERKESV